MKEVGCDEDIDTSIIMGKKATNALRDLMRNNNVRNEISKNIVREIYSGNVPSNKEGTKIKLE